MGDGSSDLPVMMHVNQYDGLTIAVSEAKFITSVARRTVLSDNAMSVLVPVLEEVLRWDSPMIRRFFAARGLTLSRVGQDRAPICSPSMRAPALRQPRLNKFHETFPHVISTGGRRVSRPEVACPTPNHPAICYPFHPILEVFMAAQKILMLVGDYVEDYEVMVPFQALLMVGHNVHAVCPGKKSGEVGPHGHPRFRGRPDLFRKARPQFRAQRHLRRHSPEEYDALVIPGGRAPEYIRLNPRVLEIVRHFATAQKPIAAICHGAQVSPPLAS